MKQSYQQKRERAIAAAAKVFAEKGYHGSTTKDIADSLGIRQGSLYYYFQSKEEALEEVCMLALRDYVSRMETIAASPLSFPEKIYETIRSHLGSYRDNNEALKVHNDQRLYLPEEKRERIKRDGSRYREVLESIFIDEIAKSTLPADSDVEFLSQSIIGLCNSWGSVIVRDHDLNTDDLSKQCTRLIIRGAGYQAHNETPEPL